MTGSVKRVAMVSMDAAPDAQPGSSAVGGMNVTIVETARELARRDVQVDLIARATDGAGSHELAPGVTVHALHAGESTSAAHPVTTMTDEFGEAVARLSRENDYDIIHAHHWRSGIAVLPVALELGTPLVQSFHSIGAMAHETGVAPQEDRRLWSERFLANQAEAIIASSSAEAATLIDSVGAPAKRVWVIPPGVDGSVFFTGRTEKYLSVHAFLGIDSERPIISVIGRLEPLKDQELAIRAFAELASPRPLLVLVGEPAPGHESYVGHLRRLATTLGVGADVRFLGALVHAQVSHVFAASAIALVPSLAETYGLVVLEAAASGIPVVASRTGGLMQSVVDGHTGVLVGSREPGDWAAVIRQLLDDPARREHLGANGHERALGLTWAATATSILGVYASVSAATSSR